MTQNSKRLLVLGGTGFVGRHITEAALDAGHDVTVFNRGQTNAALFADATHLTGDRSTGELAALKGAEWDAVVDVNAYIPRHVAEAAAALEGRVGHYTFISTVSVYQPAPAGPLTEESPTGVLDDPASEEVTNASYGPLKVLCEDVARAAFSGHCTVIRPGIVAGPHDPTDRFTYWVRRAEQGGEMLVPDRPDQPVQVVHGRDQGDFVVKASVEGIVGDFNSVGPTEPLTLAGMLEACRAAADVDTEFVWVPESSARALAAGMVNRSIEQTVADTLAWDRTRPDRSTMAPGTLSAAREAEALAALRA